MDATRTPDGPGNARIEHVIVLAFENRSFDHLFGFLDHPSDDFDGVVGKPRLGNRLDPAHTTSRWIAPEPTAEYVVPLDPDHEHGAVMGQITAVGDVANAGFVGSLVRKALASMQGQTRHARFRAWGRRIAIGAGFVALVLVVFRKWWFAAAAFAAAAAGIVIAVMNRPRAATRDERERAEAMGPSVMRCFSPDKVPVISTLAKEFAVCQRWFCSVPGETWPNRNFFHAATSSGSVNIELGFYRDRTIFEVLDETHSWRVYYGQFPPQVFFFPFVLRHSIFRSNSLQDLLHDLEAGNLPAYAFVEPHHGLLGREPSCSQHPGNNVSGKHDGGDFRAGERLIGEIYQRLRANEQLFRETLLIVTYDEHGGLYDHRPPEATVAPGPRQSTLSRRLLQWLLARDLPPTFDFRLLGPRVPCVVISPWIAKGTIDDRVRDHSTIPATVQALFAPGTPPLGNRAARASSLEELLTLDRPRTDDLPDVVDAMTQLGDPPLFDDDVPSVPTEAAAARPEAPQSQFDWQLVELTDAIVRGTVPPRGPVGRRMGALLRRGDDAPKLRRPGPVRRARLRAKSVDELAKLHDDAVWSLGAIAAEQLEAQ